MYFVKTELKRFSAAHRVNKNYRGKCQHLHGHDYRLHVIIAAREVNRYDFVIDFDDVKRLLNDWVQERFDHATLLSEMDASLTAFVLKEGQRHYILPGGSNTSVECLAKHLYEKFTEIFKENAISPSAFIHTVEVWESDKSGAMYSEEQMLLTGDPCG